MELAPSIAKKVHKYILYQLEMCTGRACNCGEKARYVIFDWNIELWYNELEMHEKTNQIISSENEYVCKKCATSLFNELSETLNNMCVTISHKKETTSKLLSNRFRNF
jgi:hypothetical protein